jgi:hypothetical protein
VKTKVGLPAFADDPGRLRRYAIALPSAIVLTLLFFALGFLRPPETPAGVRPDVTSIALERRVPVARPTPTRPPPPPPPRRVAIAEVPQRAAPQAARVPGGAPAPAAQPVHKALTSVPVAAATAAGNGTGPGTGPGPAEGTGDAGPVGTGGTGTAAVDADAPCGSVDFIPDDAPRRAGGTAYETIRATVRFPDGHSASALFPYAWVYPDATNTDPWSPRNLREPDFPARAQLPPPGTDLRRYPAVIRYIIEHTRADGTTVLQECPKPR